MLKTKLFRGVLLVLLCAVSTGVYAEELFTCGLFSCSLNPYRHSEVVRRANAGDTWDQARLGYRYWVGTDQVYQNKAKAVQWFLKSVRYNEPKLKVEAAEFLFHGYENGIGVKKNPNEAEKWLKIWVDSKGKAEAQELLGRRYWHFHKDYARAVKYFRMAAEQGNTLAMVDLGTAYSLGKGVAQNDAEGVRLLRRAAAAGEPVAQYFLGVLYATTSTLDRRDNVIAWGWIVQAISNGSEKSDAYRKVWYEDAKRRRDNLYKEMTPDQREKARITYAAWLK